LKQSYSLPALTHFTCAYEKQTHGPREARLNSDGVRRVGLMRRGMRKGRFWTKFRTSGPKVIFIPFKPSEFSHFWLKHGKVMLLSRGTLWQTMNQLRLSAPNILRA